MLSWQIRSSTEFTVFRETITAINKEIDMPGIPFNDENALLHLSSGFASTRSAHNPLRGCIGSLHEIAIKIVKPPDKFAPRNYYCRKGFYALPVLAVVDASYRFLYMSCRCSGSTHDSVAFDVSSLAGK